ncbi:caspase domain-containing protein [Crepidotus variabilis]|uniref:Caspase domain-containing protein n=1 Tax=Crepidotus variabilis TaxID=179855 RepID=A0A9P6JMP6_9AGAR|nr:caspase domain-containing protein [Crepidotus variabilis]
MHLDLKFKARARKFGGWFRRHLPTMRIPKFLGRRRRDNPPEPAGSIASRRSSKRSGLVPNGSHKRQESSVSVAMSHAFQAGLAVASPGVLPDDSEPLYEEPLPFDNEAYVEVDASSSDDGKPVDRHESVNGHVPKSTPGRKKALLIGISGESPEETQEPDPITNDSEPQNGEPVEGENGATQIESAARAMKDAMMGLHRKGKSEGGISAVSSSDKLKGPHNEVEVTRSLLIERYGYKNDDITILVDTDGQDDEFMPTKANIEKHIHLLVKDAKAGDKFYFHYSGHSTQEKTGDPREEDGMNEVLCTWDRQRIPDNDLRAWMVDKLDPHSTLYAVFDTCNSGTILDLEHYRCNKVYLPWVNKGTRRTKSRHILAHRQHALPPRVPTLNNPQAKRSTTGNMTMGSIEQVIQPPLPEDGPLTQEAIQQRKQSTDLAFNLSRRSVIVENALGEQLVDTPRSSIDAGSTYTRPASINSEMRKYMSPIEMFCDGWCRQRFDRRTEGLPHVVCLSSCADGQKTWEDKNGSSMTSALVSLLNENPHPSFTKVLHQVNNSLHKDYLHLHSKARDYKRQVSLKNERHRRLGKPLFVPSVDPEMNNFQEVHLSSLEPLELTEAWDP